MYVCLHILGNSLRSLTVSKVVVISLVLRSRDPSGGTWKHGSHTCVVQSPLYLRLRYLDIWVECTLHGSEIPLTVVLLRAMFWDIYRDIGVYTSSTYGISNNKSQHCSDTLGLLYICLSLIYSFILNDSSGSSETQRQRQIRYHPLIVLSRQHPRIRRRVGNHCHASAAAHTFNPPYSVLTSMLRLYHSTNICPPTPCGYTPPQKSLSMLCILTMTYNSLVLFILADVRFEQMLKLF